MVFLLFLSVQFNTLERSLRAARTLHLSCRSFFFSRGIFGFWWTFSRKTKPWHEFMSDQCSVCSAWDIAKSSPISVGLAVGLHRPAGSPSGKPLFFLSRGKIAFSGFGERYMGIIPCFCYFFCPFPQNRWMSFFLAFSMENDPTFTKTLKKITFTKTRKYL